MQVSLTFVIELTAVGVLTNLLYFPQQIYIIKKWEPNSILCDTSSFINRTQKISIMYSITAQNKDKSTATMILQIIKTRYKLSSLLMYLPMMYHNENNDTHTMANEVATHTVNNTLQNSTRNSKVFCIQLF